MCLTVEILTLLVTGGVGGLWLVVTKGMYCGFVHILSLYYYGQVTAKSIFKILF